MDESDEHSVRIDLEATNLAFAVYLNEQIRALDNLEDCIITPFFVIFTEENRFIGGSNATKIANRNNPEGGIEEIKRFIGQKYDNKRIQENTKHLLYTIEEESNEPIKPEETLRKISIEIGSSILLKIKEDIEAKIKQKNSLVTAISVPACEATATSAVVQYLKLLNALITAAYRYLFAKKRRIQNNNLFLIHHVSGDTYNVRTVKKAAENVEAAAVDDDSFLGGHNLDYVILKCSALPNKYKFNSNFDKKNNCEDAKTRLSYFEECEIILADVIDVNEIKILRDDFELVANYLFTKTIDTVVTCLNSSNQFKYNFKKVVLSGDTTRTSKTLKFLSSCFGKKVIDQFLQPDESVPEEAAIEAAKRFEQTISMIKDLDVTPLSIGLRSSSSLMDVVIKQGTPIPCRKIIRRVTVKNNQTYCIFNIYEGERADCRKNRHLGRLVLENLTPAPPQQCKVFVTMTIDNNGILTVLAKEQFKNNTKELKVDYTEKLKSDAKVKDSLKDAEENAIADNMFMQFAKKKKYLKHYYESVIYNIEAQDLMKKYEDIYTFCKTSREFINKIGMDGEDRLFEQIIETKLKCENLVEEYNFCFMPKLI